MTDDAERIGGGSRRYRHLAIYVGGVAVGSAVRFVEWAVPERIERVVKDYLP